MVRANLHGFLLSLRAMIENGEPIFLWIDAICIDQLSISERNHQVQLMPLIYSKASRVIAWLGPATSDTDHYVAYLKSERDVPRFGSEVITDLRKLRLLALESSTLALARRIIELPYWYRMWTVQEIVLARDIILLWGTRKISWEEFQHRGLADINASCLYYRLVEGREGLGKTSGKALELNYLHKLRRSRRCLGDLIYKFNCQGNRTCSVAHDYVYALLGLVNCENRSEHLITIDYSSNVVALFIDFLRAGSMRQPFHLILTMLQRLSITEPMLEEHNIHDLYGIRFNPQKVSIVDLIWRGADKIFMRAIERTCSGFVVQNEPPASHEVSEEYLQCLGTSEGNTVLEGDFVYTIGNDLCIIVRLHKDSKADTEHQLDFIGLCVKYIQDPEYEEDPQSYGGLQLVNFSDEGLVELKRQWLDEFVEKTSVSPQQDGEGKVLFLKTDVKRFFSLALWSTFYFFEEELEDELEDERQSEVSQV